MTDTGRHHYLVDIREGLIIRYQHLCKLWALLRVDAHDTPQQEHIVRGVADLLSIQDDLLKLTGLRKALDHLKSFTTDSHDTWPHGLTAVARLGYTRVRRLGQTAVARFGHTAVLRLGRKAIARLGHIRQTKHHITLILNESHMTLSQTAHRARSRFFLQLTRYINYLLTYLLTYQLTLPVPDRYSASTVQCTVNILSYKSKKFRTNFCQENRGSKDMQVPYMQVYMVQHEECLFTSSFCWYSSCLSTEGWPGCVDMAQHHQSINQ